MYSYCDNRCTSKVDVLSNVRSIIVSNVSNGKRKYKIDRPIVGREFSKVRINRSTMSEKTSTSDDSESKATPPVEIMNSTDWDPTSPKNVAAVYEATGQLSNPFAPFLLRIRRDMMAFCRDPPPGILALQDDSDMTVIHALINGSSNTPYDRGFFYFIVRCPPDYPIKPPHVKFMTTGGGSVRFNPNLYTCGKVCISILGTWSGPEWTPALTLSSVLISIQSLLTENPYHNEPGFEKEKNVGDSKRYNEIIQHETIRVAVIGMVDNETRLFIPEPMIDAIKQSFLENYDFYEATLTSKLHLSGTAMEDPFGGERGVFNHKYLLERLKTLRKKLTSTIVAEESATSSTSSSTVSPDSE